VGAYVAGPRSARFDDKGEPDETGEFAPHSVPLVVNGTFTLWFGWYGFNCGSTLAMSDAATGALAAQVAMNTTIAAAFGGIVTFFILYYKSKKYDIIGMCSGILAGLVSITAGCGNVESGSAAIIGTFGAFVYIGAKMLLMKLQIDDPLDAFPIHGACGIWGVLAAALFDWGNGFDFAHGWNGFSCVTNEDGTCKSGAWGQMFVANIVEIIAISLWTATLSAAVFVPLKMFGILTADDESQRKGFDMVKFNPDRAYHMGHNLDYSRKSVSGPPQTNTVTVGTKVVPS
jgi:Amt family ammonium transporter